MTGSFIPEDDAAAMCNVDASRVTQRRQVNNTVDMNISITTTFLSQPPMAYIPSVQQAADVMIHPEELRSASLSLDDMEAAAA